MEEFAEGSLNFHAFDMSGQVSGFKQVQFVPSFHRTYFRAIFAEQVPFFVGTILQRNGSYHMGTRRANIFYFLTFVVLFRNRFYSLYSRTDILWGFVQ